MGRAGEGGEGSEREEKIGEEERWGRGGGGEKMERRGRGSEVKMCNNQLENIKRKS